MYPWKDLDALVGGLPRSAYQYDAFWKGPRSGWPGFTTIDVRVGESVTFVRRPTGQHATAPEQQHRRHQQPAGVEVADLLLVTCVKQKLDHTAPARDLYTSPLFRKERAYAEASGLPWFILSAVHGLVEPATVLEPYELRLSATPRSYRSEWGARVVAALAERLAPLGNPVVEVHAGAAYADPIRPLLLDLGCRVVEPLRGLTMGQRLAWYRSTPGLMESGNWQSARTNLSSTAYETPRLSAVVSALASPVESRTPAEFLATDGAGLRVPGLYSWWVDATGARELGRGLGFEIQPGLIYVGLAGATRSRSGRRSTNTLWGRIRGMHLGRRHEFSTFRRTLGSVLANATGEPAIDETSLTAWMHGHLTVVAVPVPDGDVLNSLESAVLQDLDPPLNLAKMAPSPIRLRLTELRRTYGRS
ncbi:UNVERIFIED_CONTAM: hypothetical protein LK11_06950 [Mumia flava]